MKTNNLKFIWEISKYKDIARVFFISSLLLVIGCIIGAYILYEDILHQPFIPVFLSINKDSGILYEVEKKEKYVASQSLIIESFLAQIVYEIEINPNEEDMLDNLFLNSLIKQNIIADIVKNKKQRKTKEYSEPNINIQILNVKINYEDNIGYVFFKKEILIDNDQEIVIFERAAINYSLGRSIKVDNANKNIDLIGLKVASYKVYEERKVFL